MKLLRNLLYPFSILYGGVVWLRNKCFDWGFLESQSFNVPVICVGNLNVGGTGKSPMIEYLIRLLKDNYKVATLSRGYKRKTSGFKEVLVTDTAQDVGDEPLQFKRKYKSIKVAVDEKRAHGITELLAQNDAPNLILLDDAFQHRYVKAGFNIMLTSYNDLYINDIMLPTGNLREPKSGVQRADSIVVTKCPDNLSISERTILTRKLQVSKHQPVFFSYISYSDKIYNAIEERYLNALDADTFTLVTGIANPLPLVEFLKTKGLKFNHLTYPDHHNFSETDFESLKQKGFVLTTEKDYVRLSKDLNASDLFYLPIETKFYNEALFNTKLIDYLKH
jgi:tetraacyldisaccharide 4'-kinase